MTFDSQRTGSFPEGLEAVKYLEPVITSSGPASLAKPPTREIWEDYYKEKQRATPPQAALYMFLFGVIYLVYYLPFSHNCTVPHAHKHI